MCIFSSCGQIVFGIFMLICLVLTATATFYGETGRLLTWDCLKNEQQCDPWEKENISGMRAIAAFLCLALVFEVISLIWNFVTFCACCWKKYIIHPLIVLSFFCVLFLVVTIIVCLVTYKGKIPSPSSEVEQHGVCFWFVVGATKCAVIGMVAAILSVILGERGL